MGVGGIKRSSRTQGIIRNPPGERKVKGFDSSCNAPSPSFSPGGVLRDESNTAVWETRMWRHSPFRPVEQV